MNANEIIEASAGTGKTQALAERIIALMRSGIRPCEIVALTFSRAAAGEIFERLVMLLAEKGEIALLRSVIEAQHLMQIGTLDSFMMRIVRNFPLEMGIGGDIRLMDEFEAKRECERATFSILRRTDRATTRAFVQAFSLAMRNENVRSFVDSYKTFIADWHKLVLELPKGESWWMTSEVVHSDASTDVEALSSAADALLGLVDHPKWNAFVEDVRKFRGKFSFSGFGKKLLELENLLDGEGFVEFDFSRRHYAFPPNQARLIRNAFRAMSAFVVNRQRRLAAGVYRIISAYEKEYAASVRNVGRLVFDDIPRFLASLPESARMSLEYRLDSRISAWALDEFQDTSRAQWKALSNLIDEAKQSGGEKSVFIVGDRKQAIYGWREGDVSIFEREIASGDYLTSDLKKSYRYGAAITEAVNRVFAEGMIFERFPDWKSPIHETVRTNCVGFVQVVESPGKNKGDFVDSVYNALKAVDPVGRGLSAAVLVRFNDFGRFLAQELKRRGLEGVVWEGESKILDTPALRPFLDLVWLADHPSDLMVQRHFALTPLAAAIYPDGVPSAVEISDAAASLFVTKGLVRALRELRARLPVRPEEAWDEFTESRFVDLLRAAADFENTKRPNTRLGDFLDFLKSMTKRNVAESGKIRILTIHRSKGLGFDYVVLPLYEYDAINKPSSGALIGDGWILPDLDKKACRAFPELMQAAALRQRKVEQEALSTYYVAMTRAKQAMTIVMHPPAKTATDSIRFSDLVRAALPTEIGNRAWASDFASTVSTPVVDNGLVPPMRKPRLQIRRRLPSLKLATGESAAQLFSLNGRQAAIEHGNSIHAELAKVEFNDVLVRPKNCTGLWRERAFEVFDGKDWVSGRFDRVVFTGEGAERSAEIVDFKTGRQGDEGKYVAQLAAYKSALTALTGIPSSRISTRIMWV